MPLTTKDSPELAAQKPEETAFEAPTKKFSRPVKPIPVCLEIPVTVRGTRPKPGTTAVTPEMEPFSEETRTVIVFEKGGVLRLNGAATAGQTMTVVNSRSGAEAGCRVVNTRNFPTVKGYVEVEFVEQAGDFWGVHFPGDANASSNPSASVAAQPVVTDPVEVEAVPALLPPQKSSPLDTATSTAEFWSTQFSPDETSAPAPPSVAPRAPAVPIADTPAPTPPVVPQPVAAAASEPSAAHGAGPSFEDLNGLGLLPPPPRKQAPRPLQLAADSTFSRGIEDTQHLADSIAPAGVSEGQFERSAPIRTSARIAAHAVVARRSFTGGLLASATAAGRSGGSGKKIWLAAAAIVLVAGGAVAGVLYWRGSQDNSIAAAHVAPPPALTSSPAASAAQSLAPRETVEEEAARLSQAAGASTPVKETPAVERDVPKSDASSRVETVSAPAAAHAASAKLPAEPAKKHVPLTSLKMSAPIEAKTRSSSAPPVLDAVSTEPGAAVPAGISTALPAMLQGDQAPAPPPPQIETRVVEGGKITPPRAISTSSPQYPAIARQAHISGDVVVDAQVDVNGRVVSAQAVDGPSALRQAAVDAVRQWKYAPAMLDGVPTAAHIMVTVKFRLQ